MKCLICFKEFQQHKRGRTKLYCSNKCRYFMSDLLQKEKTHQPRKCKFCQQLFEWRSYELYCNKNCKTKAQKVRNKNKQTFSICVICKKLAIGSSGRVRKYCSFECQLKGIYGGKPPLSERSRKAQRNMRERSAPGLTYLEVRALRIKWQKEGRVCQYCQGSFDTIDHVIPLTRGGDNMLTNLVPSCRSCNSSKGMKLLSEWKPQVYA